MSSAHDVKSKLEKELGKKKRSGGGATVGTGTDIGTFEDIRWFVLSSDPDMPTDFNLPTLLEIQGREFHFFLFVPLLSF